MELARLDHLDLGAAGRILDINFEWPTMPLWGCTTLLVTSHLRR